MLEKLKSKYLTIIVCLASLTGGLWHNQFIYDGYHWGFIFSNSLEFINGKTPYREIFLEYGIVSVIINSLILIVFNKNVYSIIALTCITYSLSLFFISNIVYKITQNKYYSVFSIVIIFILYPWPTVPWPNFYSFFFTILFCLYCFNSKKIYSLLAGIFLALAYLTLTTVYNYIIILFFLFVILSIGKIRNRNKLLNILIGFLSVVVIFFCYLGYNNLLDIWISYQKLPFIQQSVYTEGGNTMYTLLLRYTYFITIYPIKNFILEPQWTIYALFFYSNILTIFFFIINIYNVKNLKFAEEIFIINLLILSLNVYAQVLGIEKLATSIALGSVSLVFIIFNLKKNDTKFVLFFIIIFTCLYSLIFTFNLESSKIAGLRTAHIKELINFKLKIKNDQLRYFKSQKWDNEKWITLDKINNIQKEIKKKCDLNYGANLTANSFFHSIIQNKKLQIIPFFDKTNGKVFRKLIEPNLINDIQSQINNDNIFLITSENNQKMLNLNEYDIPIEIMTFNNKDKINNKSIYIYFPKNCF